MNTESMIKELRLVAKKNRGKVHGVGELRLSDMCEEVAHRLEELIGTESIKKMYETLKPVPTGLAVKVDDTHEVRYKRLDDCLGYEFEVFPQPGADIAVEKVVSQMEDQSFNSWASWRRTSLEEVQKEDPEGLDMYRYFVVKFRVRDAG